MKKISALFALLLFVSFVAIFSFLPSCKKETDSTVIVTVVDSTGTPVVGATIVLHPDSASLKGKDPLDGQVQSKTSDVAGKAQFVFKYEAILKVDASRGTLSNVGDVVKLEPGKQVEKMVTVK